jgi:alkanesulfonate monooxygenase SsuD/methylene tetrahydromethanopterin reductase-like flavin-dependent oxidoreductase (luciferase family)
LKFGNYLFTEVYDRHNRGSLFDDVAEQTILSEKVGFCSAVVGDHHVSHHGILEPMAVMSALASQTKKIKIGVSILILPVHNPLYIAEYLSTMDIISKGRILAGFGIGYMKQEYEAFGVDYKRRGMRFEEAFTIIRRLLTEETVTFRGKYYNLSNVFVNPRSCPPLYMNGMSDPGIIRAAKLADGWMSSSYGYDEYKRQLAVCREALKRFNRDVSKFEMFAAAEGCISKDYETARKLGESHMMKKYEAYAGWDNPILKDVPKEEITFDRLVKKFSWIIGGPDEWIRQIESFEKLGVDHIFFRFSYPGMKNRDVLDMIRLLGEKVIPYFGEK